MWQLKNTQTASMVLVFFTKEEVNEACQSQIDDEFPFVTLRKQNYLGFEEIAFEVRKEEFEPVVKYDPTAWNDFSKVKPPRPGFYCVSNWKIKDYPSEAFQVYWDGKQWKFPDIPEILSFRQYSAEPKDFDGFWDTKGL